jgi:hypothetical protein
LSNRWIIPEIRTLPAATDFGPAGTQATVYYQARDRGGKAAAKYLNPYLPKQIYGARSLDRPTGILWISEGVFDVLPLIEAGESALATLGTHLGELGIEALTALIGKRLVVIVHDHDRATTEQPLGAGRAAALALAARLTSLGIRAIPIGPPSPFKDLGEWVTKVPVPRVIGELRMSL